MFSLNFWGAREGERGRKMWYCYLISVRTRERNNWGALMTVLGQRGGCRDQHALSLISEMIRSIHSSRQVFAVSGRLGVLSVPWETQFRKLKIGGVWFRGWNAEGLISTLPFPDKVFVDVYV